MNTIDLTQGVTDDFCECYATKADCTGFTSRMIADEILPEAVNPKDPRVIQIIQWCRENNPVVDKSIPNDIAEDQANDW